MKKLRNKKGQGMSEYLIILALVAIATIGAVIFFADNVREQISNITEEIAGVDAVLFDLEPQRRFWDIEKCGSMLLDATLVFQRFQNVLLLQSGQIVVERVIGGEFRRLP